MGSCTDCIGEVNGTLNACTLSSASCVSSQNEDEDHFMAPWQYPNSTDAAIDNLVAVATGEKVHAYLCPPYVMLEDIFLSCCHIHGNE